MSFRQSGGEYPRGVCLETQDGPIGCLAGLESVGIRFWSLKVERRRSKVVRYHSVSDHAFSLRKLFALLVDNLRVSRYSTTY